jgi:hypothetical protein
MPNFAVPKFFKPGARDRSIRFGKVKGVPPYRDTHYVVPESEWLDHLRDPNRPVGSKNVWSVYDQDGVGSCASESADGAMKLCREGAGRKRVEFNPWGTYGRVNGGRDGGSSLDANVEFKKNYGSFPEDVWPRSNGWKKQPTDAAYEAAYNYRLDEARDIDNSSASQFYAEFFSAFMIEDSPLVYFGYPGHAIVATDIVEEAKATTEMVECANLMDQYLLESGLLPCLDNVGGLVDTLYIEYLNSWHESWGNHGLGYLRASRVQRSYGAFVFLSTTKEKE